MKRTVGIVAALVLICASSGQQMAQAQESGKTQREIKASPASDDEAIVSELAQKSGKRIEDVRSRIKASGDAEKIKPKVVGDDAFAEIEVTDTGIVVKTSTGKAFDNLPKISSKTTFRKVPFSLKALQAATESVAEQKIPGIHSIALDIDNGALIVKTETPLKNRIETQGVRYSVVVEAAPVPTSVQGGEHPTTCTTGFSFYPDLVSTASHCGWSYSIDKYTGGTESVSPYAEYCYSETQLMSAPGDSVAQVRGNVIKGSGSFANGEFYYRYGKMTGWTSGTAGGWVYYTMAGATDCNGVGYWLIQLNGPAAIGGDAEDQ